MRLGILLLLVSSPALADQQCISKCAAAENSCETHCRTREVAPCCYDHGQQCTNPGLCARHLWCVNNCRANHTGCPNFCSAVDAAAVRVQAQMNSDPKFRKAMDDFNRQLAAAKEKEGARRKTSPAEACVQACDGEEQSCEVRCRAGSPIECYGGDGSRSDSAFCLQHNRCVEKCDDAWSRCNGHC